MEKRTTNFRGFCSPNRYLQGPGIINSLKLFTDLFGSNIVFYIDKNIASFVSPKIKQIFDLNEINYEIIEFSGEITLASIESNKDKLLSIMSTADVLVAIGGGKTIDVTKVIAEAINVPIIVVPSVASTDAPTSGLSIIYKENGEHSHEIFLKKNPDFVIVDSEIIVKAPVRFFISGIGDALATFFEAEANQQSNYENVLSAEIGLSIGPSIAAKTIAKSCYETIIRDAELAVEAVKLGRLTEAVENIIEANTLLSGIGFETNGTAAAHAIHDGLTSIKPSFPTTHGERVAFGLLCEFIIENKEKSFIDSILQFYRNIGLPTTLSQIGLENLTNEQLLKIADITFNNVIHAEPVVITKEVIINSILLADHIGKNFKD
jgi:glycerol dehydrogenase